MVSKDDVFLIATSDKTCRYNALAGIADPSNSFFLIPVVHFPWSDKGREQRGKVDNSAAKAEQQV